jgi:hypothetical protein
MAVGVLSLCDSWKPARTSPSGHVNPYNRRMRELIAPQTEVRSDCNSEEAVTIQAELFQHQYIMNSPSD